MRRLILMFAVLSALTGCNSTDALTPQVDVGGGTFRSPPVNQSDLDAMSRQTGYVTPPATGQVERLPAAADSFGDPARSGTVYMQGNADYTDPAGSLEAQAGQLRRGEPPLQTRASLQTRARIDQDAGESVGRDDPAAREMPEKAGEATQENAEPADAADASPSSERQKTAALAKNANARTLRFLPIIGAPVEAVRPLSRQLGLHAKATGLTIKSAADPGDDPILKGYFSVFSEGKNTIVVYVWDVLDGTGNRLHRLQGQIAADPAVAGGKTGDWSAVPAKTMEEIATKTIDGYLDWQRNSRR